MAGNTQDSQDRREAARRSAAEAQNRIAQKWDSTTAAQTAQRQAQHENEKANYAAQSKAADEQYHSLKNQAGVNRAMQERIRRENMANMGLSGAGGTSRTMAQRNTNNYLGELGNISRQKQDYADNVSLALSNLDRQYNADVSAIEATNAAQRSGEQTQYAQWRTGSELQKAQFAAANQQFAQQYAAQQQAADFENAYKLYAKKVISKRQLQELTGYDAGSIQDRITNTDPMSYYDTYSGLGIDYWPYY